VEEKKRVSLSFIDPAPKINLVEAHLNRPSLQAKGTIALHSINRSWNASRASLQNEGRGAAGPRPFSRCYTWRKRLLPPEHRGKIDKTRTERTFKHHQGVSMPLEKPFVYVHKIPSIQIFEC
jgi:hypothetical protein